MVGNEPGRPQAEAAGSPVEAARIRQGVPAAGADPVAERQDARDELGGAEVAVPYAGRVGLAEQVPGAGRGNSFRVEVLLLDGDELVGDGVQVQLGDGQA